MSVKRISHKEIRKAGGLERAAAAAPAGISPVLRSSWKFARDMAKRFGQELVKDRVEELLKKLSKRFV